MIWYMNDSERNLRSNCPVNFGLESFGDKWSLLIIRDIVFWGKRKYGDFLDSDERIATNILAARLSQLEQEGILVKSPDPVDKRRDVYSLTEKGLELIPLLVEIISWSGKLEEWQTVGGRTPPQQIAAIKKFATAKDKSKIVDEIKRVVRRGGYYFEGVEQPKNPRIKRKRN
jgi:DNA-binding HxlR family transcriptional regulator